MSLDSGLQTSKGLDIFDNKFIFLEYLKLSASEIYDNLLKLVFNTTSGMLHIENLKGVDGEIGLKIGENEYFGVINVGDSDKLVKLCESNGITISSKDFSNSLFQTINEDSSNLHILIGSKKFSEGWNSWRVSTMGLMNVGRSEGSQVIQLFGRGVRLKGHDFCLKRSRALRGKELERKHQAIETLHIFGLKADYMKTFKEYLKSEGIPTDERIEFVMPVIYDKKYKTKKLKVLDLQKDRDFKREVSLDLKHEQNKTIFKKVLLNLYKQVDVLDSEDQRGNVLEFNSEKLQAQHLSFINIDNVFFALQQFKNEKCWSNLSISKEVIYELLQEEDWYTLEIPETDMKINSFKNLTNFETIIISLLKKYIKAFYEYKKSEWESQFLEYRELDETKDSANLIENYTITVEDKETALIERLNSLKTMLEKEEIDDVELHRLSKKDLKVFPFDKHLYNPLIFKDKGETTLQIKPIHLNDGEKDFIGDLSVYMKQETAKYKDIEMYLLRNQSKTGLGFFTEGNFYPDFIMWIKKGEKQYINFIDPKGIRNSNPKNDPKINFSSKIKEIETQMGDNDISLNSFVVSNTSLRSLNILHTDLNYDFFESKNVLFQEDHTSTYIEKMFYKILN